MLLATAQIKEDGGQFEEAIRLYEKIGDRYSVARGKAYYGEWLLDNGGDEKAIPLLEEAREIWMQIDFAPGVEWIDELLASEES